MRFERLAAALAFAAIAGCTTAARQEKATFIDLSFPIGRSAAQAFHPHAVDPTGALWYLDGDALVRQTGPSKKSVLRDANFRSGNVFWYDGAIYVLHGGGREFSRVDGAMHASTVKIPERYAPIEGAIADAKHRAIVAVQRSARELAVVDVWTWYLHRVPDGIDPFSASVAGGPHGKKFLVVADRRRPLIGIENRWNGKSALVRLPPNGCFANTQAAIALPVDVRGRDSYRTWATTGAHVASIDLNTKKVLRVWDVDGCALHVVSADGDGVTVIVAASTEKGYVSRVVRFDRDGVHDVDRYGQVYALLPRATLDAYGRLWWFDAVANAFICRTPL